MRVEPFIYLKIARGLKKLVYLESKVCHREGRFCNQDLENIRKRWNKIKKSMMDIISR